MLYELLVTSYLIVCILLVFIILIQKGKGGTGFGAFTAGTQVLFGGSGGQDIFQKTTWVLGALFMIMSLSLALIKTRQSQSFRYTKTIQQPLAPATHELPSEAPSSTTPDNA